MEEKSISLIIVENHPIVREGLRNALEATGVCKVVAEAEDGPSAVLACQKHLHDIVLVNAVLPGSDSFEVIASIKKQFNKKIIVSYISEDATILHELRKCGADGFIGKEAASAEYYAAIKAVYEGGLYFSQNMADLIFNVARATADKTNAYGLTERELEILSMLASGYCNKEVANQHDLSVRTVEAHRLNIRRKTRSNTLSDLVRISRSLGLASMAGNYSNTALNISKEHMN
jgi:DNA-binding NarL/FixJ family response regulator